MVSWSAGIRPSTAFAMAPARMPSNLRITKVRAFVGAGKTGVSSVPGGGNLSSISGTTPSLTSSSAMRSGVSARFRRIGASHFLRNTPSA